MEKEEKNNALPLCRLRSNDFRSELPRRQYPIGSNSSSILRSGVSEIMFTITAYQKVSVYESVLRVNIC